jgi:hypothetical protein
VEPILRESGESIMGKIVTFTSQAIIKHLDPVEPILRDKVVCIAYLVNND